MSRSSRRKTLSHTDIESFLSEMSVPIVQTENIPPVQTAPDIKAENAYVNGTNIDVIATEDTGAVDEKAWIRELCKLKFNSIVKNPMYATERMCELGLNIMNNSNYVIIPTRRMKPEMYEFPASSLEGKKKLLLSLGPMLTDNDTQRKIDVAACEAFTRCSSTKSKTRCVGYEYTDLDNKVRVDYDEFERRYLSFIHANQKLFLESLYKQQQQQQPARPLATTATVSLTQRSSSSAVNIIPTETSVHAATKPSAAVARRQSDVCARPSNDGKENQQPSALPPSSAYANILYHSINTLETKPKVISSNNNNGGFVPSSPPLVSRTISYAQALTVSTSPAAVALTGPATVGIAMTGTSPLAPSSSSPSSSSSLVVAAVRGDGETNEKKRKGGSNQSNHSERRVTLSPASARAMMMRAFEDEDEGIEHAFPRSGSLGGIASAGVPAVSSSIPRVVDPLECMPDDVGAFSSRELMVSPNRALAREFKQTETDIFSNPNYIDCDENENEGEDGSNDFASRLVPEVSPSSAEAVVENNTAGMAVATVCGDDFLALEAQQCAPMAVEEEEEEGEVEDSTADIMLLSEALRDDKGSTAGEGSTVRKVTPADAAELSLGQELDSFLNSSFDDLDDDPFTFDSVPSSSRRGRGTSAAAQVRQSVLFSFPQSDDAVAAADALRHQRKTRRDSFVVPVRMEDLIDDDDDNDENVVSAAAIDALFTDSPESCNSEPGAELQGGSPLSSLSPSSSHSSSPLACWAGGETGSSPVASSSPGDSLSPLLFFDDDDDEGGEDAGGEDDDDDVAMGGTTPVVLQTMAASVVGTMSQQSEDETEREAPDCSESLNNVADDTTGGDICVIAAPAVCSAEQSAQDSLVPDAQLIAAEDTVAVCLACCEPVVFISNNSSTEMAVEVSVPTKCTASAPDVSSDFTAVLSSPHKSTASPAPQTAAVATPCNGPTDTPLHGRIHTSPGLALAASPLVLDPLSATVVVDGDLEAFELLESLIEKGSAVDPVGGGIALTGTAAALMASVASSAAGAAPSPSLSSLQAFVSGNSSLYAFCRGVVGDGDRDVAAAESSSESRHPLLDVSDAFSDTEEMGGAGLQAQNQEDDDDDFYFLEQQMAEEAGESGQRKQLTAPETVEPLEAEAVSENETEVEAVKMRTDSEDGAVTRDSSEEEYEDSLVVSASLSASGDQQTHLQDGGSEMAVEPVAAGDVTADEMTTEAAPQQHAGQTFSEVYPEPVDLQSATEKAYRNRLLRFEVARWKYQWELVSAQAANAAIARAVVRNSGNV